MAMEKLIIKIKIPPCPNELNFSCPFCDKSFRCGKALGGHKRVHFLKNKSDRCRNVLQNTPSSNAGNQEKDCPVCAQKFLSEKSLHGHMRKHPDRSWRGMIPPTEQQKLKNGAVSCTLLLPGVPDPVHEPPLEEEGEKVHDSSNPNHDLMLPVWPRSGRRSRYGKAPMNDDDDNQDQVIMTMSEDYEPDADKQDLSVPKKKKMEGLTSSNGGNSAQGKKHAVPDQNPGPRPKKHVSNNNDVVVDYNNIRSSSENDEFVGPVRCSMSALSGNQETRNQSTIFEFDLNELPPEWNDDAGVGGGW